METSRNTTETSYNNEISKTQQKQATTQQN